MRALVFFAVLSIVPAAAVRAEQTSNGSQVVHTRLAPVVAHRLVPPFKGVHVYSGRTARRK
jgi:hypothetical protein